MMSNNATRKACASGYRLYLCRLRPSLLNTTTTPNQLPQRYVCIGKYTTASSSPQLERDHAVNNNNNRFMSTETTAKPSLYAAVDHSKEYEEAMEGHHGGQLSLAYDEGIGKDDDPYDPFALLEEAEREFNEEAENAADLNDMEEAEYTEETESDDEDEDEDDDIDEGEVLDAYDQFNADGSIRRTESEKVALKAGAPSGGLFAIINLAGSQQKVTVDDVVIVNKLKPVQHWSVGSTHTLTSDDVLLMGSSHLTLVGLPGVKGGEVDVMVEEITKDKKVIVFKKRRRKNSRRKNGFRREVTMLRILDIRFPEKYSSHDYRGKEEEDEN